MLMQSDGAVPYSWLPNGDSQLVIELGAAAPNSDNTRKRLIHAIV